MFSSWEHWKRLRSLVPRCLWIMDLGTQHFPGLCCEYTEYKSSQRETEEPSKLFTARVNTLQTWRRRKADSQQLRSSLLSLILSNGSLSNLIHVTKISLSSACLHLKYIKCTSEIYLILTCACICMCTIALICIQLLSILLYY